MTEELLEKRLIRSERWMIPRVAEVYEVTLPDGRIKYKLEVRDEGREKRFIQRIFGRRENLEDFLENKLMKEVTG
jgi:hypothetical protein